MRSDPSNGTSRGGKGFKIMAIRRPPWSSCGDPCGQIFSVWAYLVTATLEGCYLAALQTRLISDRGHGNPLDAERLAGCGIEMTDAKRRGRAGTPGDRPLRPAHAPLEGHTAVCLAPLCSRSFQNA